MLRVLPRVCWLWLAASAVAAGGTFQVGAHNFTLPDGFEIELVAGPPLVDRPVSAAFDEEGRLYVTESSGSSAKAPEQAKDQPNRVIRFEAADATGHFTKRTVFADRLPLVEGVMWLEGSLYVGAPPSIWKLTDTDGDGVADQRSEWYQGKTVTGCGNDIHGPFLGPEGWIYWCKGAFAEQTHEVQGGRTIKDRASHIFRCRPDGTGLESIMTGGMDNPVGLAFTREGEPIFSATFLDLSGNGKRDGLGHAVYGGVFGKENAVVEDRAVIRTGPLLPAMTHYGAGAPCGMTRIQAGVLGEAYRDNLLVCLFNLHKVTRHVLEPMGATYKTRDSDFVVSDNLDFHPTDVIEDADGSVLIVDTGGWYKVCCPTSQLVKPDVLGAIYRVRKTSAPKIDAPRARPPSRRETAARGETSAPKMEDPRGLKIDWTKLEASALAALFGDERPAVVARASRAVAKMGEAGVEALHAPLASGDAAVRMQALWTLAQSGGAASRAAIRAALQDQHQGVKQTAIKILGLLHDTQARREVADALGGDLPLRRAAMEALGRLGENDPKAPPEQWAILRAGEGHADDPFLSHSLVYALIERKDPTAISLDNLGPAMRRLAGIALAELSEDSFDITSLGIHQRSFAETGVLDWFAWLVTRHPVWAPQLAGMLSEELGRDCPPADRARLEEVLGRMMQDVTVQRTALELLRGPSARASASALRAMSLAGLKKAPTEWFEVCERLLHDEPELRAPALAFARTLTRQPEGARLAAPLRELAHSAATRELRLAALEALPLNALELDAPLFETLRESLGSTTPPADRLTALSVFARAKMADSQRTALLELVPQLGPLELTRLLPAFDRALPPALAERLLTALESAPALASCPPQALREIFGKQPAALQPQCQALLARLNMDTAQQRAKLDTIAAELPTGEVRRGQLIFNGKAACTVCHSFGYLGGKFGPDLTSIGNVRSERDLLEAIVFPSASFVRSFEPMTVKLKNGTELMGLLRSETAEAVVLATAPGAEQRLPRGEVAAITPGATSLMPQGFDQILTRQELSDLIAFLKTSQPKPH